MNFSSQSNANNRANKIRKKKRQQIMMFGRAAPVALASLAFNVASSMTEYTTVQPFRWQ